MKQFIYLDIDIANSIFSQKYDGLLNHYHEKNEKQKATENKEGIETKSNINVGASILKLFNIDSNLEISSDQSEIIKNNNVYQKITDKILHDKVFDYAYDSIKDLIVDENKECDCGEYVEIKRVFTFVDMKYLKKIINNEFVKNNMVSELKSNKTNIEEIFKLIEDFIPYERMLISYDGFLIPINDKYLRVDQKNIGFMYGGELKCVGMITNIIGKDTEPYDKSDIFTMLQYSINEMLRQILPTDRENICVIHPIAIYYDKKV